MRRDYSGKKGTVQTLEICLTSFSNLLNGDKTQKSIINIEKLNGYKANVIFEIT